jgi:hypothetical protein
MCGRERTVEGRPLTRTNCLCRNGPALESGIRTTRPLLRGIVTVLPADHPGIRLLDQGQQEAGEGFLAGFETASA